MPTSVRMQIVQSPIIPVVGELIRAHPGTISLGQGVVHYGPPPQAAAAIARFWADAENHKYKLVDGLAPLQEAIAAKLAAENRIATGQAARIVVTAGGNMAFANAVLAVASAGDEIVLPAPYYFNHEMAVAMFDCRPVVVPTTADYQLDLAAIEAAIGPRTRAVVTISPNNPSGAVYPAADLCAVNELCRRRGVYHISDEAYEVFTYDGAEHFSPGSLPGAAEHTISLYSLSKAYGMASWRIGYMVLPEHLLVAVKKVQDTILICAPVIAQFAAIGALEAGTGFWREKVQALGRVRQMVLGELERVRGFCRLPPARGAFYQLLEVDTPLAPLTLVERLVREFGVAAIPGTTFGIEQGCTLRIAYGALEADTVAAGIGRLVRGLEAIVGRS